MRTWYDAVYLQAQRPYSASSHWGAGLSYTWAKGTQIGGDLFSFDYRFPTDYPHYPAPNDAELHHLCNHTAVFIVPSLHEGFGPTARQRLP